MGVELRFRALRFQALPKAFSSHCVLATTGTAHYFFSFNIPEVNIMSDLRGSWTAVYLRD